MYNSTLPETKNINYLIKTHNTVLRLNFIGHMLLFCHKYQHELVIMSTSLIKHDDQISYSRPLKNFKLHFYASKTFPLTQN